MAGTIDYDNAVMAVARALAEERGGVRVPQPTITDVNNARRILWPLLTQQEQTVRVLR